MRLSWNEVKVRAAAFAKEWRDAEYEKGETHSFYNEFFEVFGVRRRTVARYEEQVQKLDNRSGFIDLFWPGVLIVEQKSAGRDLDKAYGQAGEYFDALAEREQPRYILVSDFQTFELHDLGERTVKRFNLQELDANVESFGFILGVERRVFRDQDPANIEAAELVGRVHDALAAAGYAGPDLERFLVRLVFWHRERPGASRRRRTGWSEAPSTGPRSRPRSSAPCSSPSWRLRRGARKGRTTRPRRTS